jgi:hypothetical protein
VVGVEVEEVEAVVVVAGEYGVAVGGAGDLEPVEDAVVLKHLA